MAHKGMSISSYSYARAAFVKKNEMLLPWSRIPLTPSCQSRMLLSSGVLTCIVPCDHDTLVLYNYRKYDLYVLCCMQTRVSKN